MTALTPRTYFGLDNFFNDMFSAPFFGAGNRAQTPSMKTDIREKDGMYVMEMDLPGYEKGDIKAELSNGYLTISAVRDSGEEEKKDEEKGYVFRERYTGSCSRSFYVGENMKEEDIKAAYENGILTLTFPKEVPAQIPEKKYIAIE